MTKHNEYANARDDEISSTMEEFKAFKKYEPAFIHTTYNKDKVIRFKEEAKKANMEYIETVRDDYHVFLRTDGYNN